MGDAGVAEGRRGMLLTLAGLGVLTAEALAGLERSSVASARGRLAATERAGLTRSWRLVNGLPALHTITPRGARAAGAVGLAPARVSAGNARHAAAAASVAAALAAAFPDREVLGEPAVRRWEREHGRPLAVLPGSPAPVRSRAPGGAQDATPQAGHRPDLLLVRAGASRSGSPSRPVAIEVELTVKAPARLAAICLAWARSREVSGVIYLAERPVLAPLGRAIGEAGAQDRVLALPLASFGSAIAGAP